MRRESELKEAPCLRIIFDFEGTFKISARIALFPISFLRKSSITAIP